MPETRMEKADRSSRRLDWKVRVDKDNDNQIIIKDNWLYRIEEVIIERPEVDIVEKMKKDRSKNKKVVRMIKEMKKAKVNMIQGEEWKIEEDLVLKEEKIYIPKNMELRTEIIWLHYDVSVVEYRGKWKTVELVTRNYWWSGVTREVGQYVEGCDLCQQMKNRMEEVVRKFKLGEVLEKL